MTQWLTVSMAAEYSTVSAYTIREAVKGGYLKAYAIGKGREYRLTAADVDEWLMSRAYEPPGDVDRPRILDSLTPTSRRRQGRF